MKRQVDRNRTPDRWTPLAVPPLRRLPAPVVVRAQRIPPRHMFEAHAHRWNQVIYATSGSLRVLVESRWFVIGAEQAVWIPPGVSHEVGSAFGAEYRSLYIDTRAARAMPASYAVLGVTPLLRELIFELARAAGAARDEAYERKLSSLILAHLPRLAASDLSLPWPKAPALQRLCESLFEFPADERSIAEWGRDIGASSRTLTRRFQEELGVSFRDWKSRLRLIKALELLASGASVTRTALEVGYRSPAAFSYMFKRELGYSPSVHGGDP